MKRFRMVSGDFFALDTVCAEAAREGHLQVLPSFSSGEELLESDLENTDMVLLDMDLPYNQSWELLDILCRLPLKKRPLIFTLSGKTGEAMTGYLGERAVYCFIKPCDPRHIVRTMAVLGEELASPFGYKDIHTLVTEALRTLRVPPHLQGYPLLREAIKLVLACDCASSLSVMKDIYPAAASLLGCTVSQAEHAMRHAVDSAWMRAPLSVLQSWFGYTVSAHRSTPSNSAFVYTLAARIRQALPKYAS